MRGQRPTRPAIDRFYDNIYPEPNTGCWLWGAGCFADGYGAFGAGGAGVTVRAHRWSYQHFVGAIPAGMLVCHHCDTPACVNPAHLWVGTPAKNNEDRDSKGRYRAPGTCGERVTVSKLTEVAVRRMRAEHAAGVTRGWIERTAREHGVLRRAIEKVLSGASWRHLL